MRLTRALAVALLLLAGGVRPAFATWTLVHSDSAVGSNGVAPAAWTPSAGNLIVFLGWGQNFGDVGHFTVSGQTWGGTDDRTQFQNANGYNQHVASVSNAAAASTTITYTQSSASVIIVLEFNDSTGTKSSRFDATGTPTDLNSSGSNTTGSSPLTTTVSGDLIIGMLGDYLRTDTVTPGNSNLTYTMSVGPITQANIRAYAEWAEAGGAATYAVDANFPAFTIITIISVAYQPAGGGGGGCGQKPTLTLLGVGGCGG